MPETVDVSIPANPASRAIRASSTNCGALPALARVLDTVPVACLRLSLAGDADTISRSADILRDAAHARDIPLVIEAHMGLVEKLGLDGVHLMDAARSVR